MSDTPLSPIPLMRLLTGFWGAKVLAAAVELGLCARLAGGRTATVAELADELGIQARPADMFLPACVSLGLLDKDGERYRNSAMAEYFLVPGGEHYFGGFVAFADHREYPAWHRLTDALRDNRPLTWDPATQESLFTAEDPVMMRLFWSAMHSLSTYTATALAGVYDFSDHKRLLDVGGGSGAFPITLCKHHPNLSAAVFDLPHACAIAATLIKDAGLENVVDTVAGDFQSDAPLPAGYDAILLSNILHDWDEETGRRLLGACWDALPSDGVLLVCELMLDPERTGPPDAALMGMNMLVETEGGQNYSQTQLTTWLTDTGFGDVHVLPLEAAGANGVLVGRRP
jgi:3-hydroxy-5-methyl-1-naphthoate 3-O-methyltransferase